MFKTIFNELKIKFKQFKKLLTNNSLSPEQANQYYGQLMFASNMVKSCLLKNKTIFNEEEIKAINLYQENLKKLKSEFATLLTEESEIATMIDDFKVALPNRIKTDALEKVQCDI